MAPTLELRITADERGLTSLKTLIDELRSVTLGAQGVQGAIKQLQDTTIKADAALKKLEATTGVAATQTEHLSKAQVDAAVTASKLNALNLEAVTLSEKLAASAKRAEAQKAKEIKTSTSLSAALRGETTATAAVARAKTEAARLSVSLSKAIAGEAEVRQGLSAIMRGEQQATLVTADTKAQLAKLSVSLSQALAGEQDLRRGLSSVMTGELRATAALSTAKADLAKLGVRLSQAIAGESEQRTGLSAVISGEAKATASASAAKAELAKLQTSISKAIAGEREVRVGLSAVIQGEAQATSGLVAVKSELPRLSTTLSKAMAGEAAQHTGLSAVISGEATATAALAQAKASLAKLNTTLSAAMSGESASKAQAASVSRGLSAALAGERTATLQAAASKDTSTVATNRAVAANSRYIASTRNATAVSRDYRSALRGISGGLGSLWVTYGNLIPLVTTFAGVLAFKKAATEGAEFEYQLRIIQGITRETDEAIQAAGESLKRFSETSIAPPQELTKGLEVLSRAGFSLADSMTALPSVYALAKVGQIDFARGTEIVSAAMYAHRLAATDIPHITDAIGKAASISATDIRSLGQAMTYTTELNSLFGTSVDETTALLATLAQRGIVSTKAGTSLRNMFVRLSAASGPAKKVLDDIGFSMYDSSGRAKDMTVAVRELAAIMARYDEESRAYIARTVAGQRAMKSFLAIADSPEIFVRNLAAITESSEGLGFLQEALEQLSSSVSGQFVVAMNNLRTALLDAFTQARPALIDLAQNLQDAFASPRFREGVAQFITVIGRLTDYLTTHGSQIWFVVRAMIAWKAATVAYATIASSRLLGILASMGSLSVAAAAGTASLSMKLAGIAPVAATAATGVTGLRAAIAGLQITTLGWVGIVTGAITGAMALWMLFKDKTIDASAQQAAALTRDVNTVNAALDRQIDRLRLRAEVLASTASVEDQMPSVQATMEAKTAALREEIARLKAQSRQTGELDVLSIGDTGPDRTILAAIAEREQQLASLEAKYKSIQTMLGIINVEEDANYKLVLQKERFREKLQRSRIDMSEEALKAEKAQLMFELEDMERRGIKFTKNERQSLVDRINLLQNIQAYNKGEDIDSATQYLTTMERKTTQLKYQAQHYRELDGATRATASATLEYDLAVGKLSAAWRAAEQETPLDQATIDRLRDAAREQDIWAKRFQDAKLDQKIETTTAALRDRTAALAKDSVEQDIATKRAALLGNSFDQLTEKQLRNLQKWEQALRDFHTEMFATNLELSKFQHLAEVANLALDQDLLTATGPTRIDIESQKALNKEIAAIKSQNLPPTLEKEAIKVATQRLMELNEQLKENYEYSRKFGTGWNAALNSYVENVTSAAGTAKTVFNSLTSNMEDAIVNFVTTGKASFNDFARSVLEDLARIAAQMAIMALFKTLTGGLFSQGAAIAGGQTIAFAKGDVFFTPSMFPMSGGRTGIFAEKGPEAIMPLTRTRDGSLGVRSTGPTQAQNTQVIKVYQPINVDMSNATGVNRQDVERAAQTGAELGFNKVISNLQQRGVVWRLTR